MLERTHFLPEHLASLAHARGEDVSPVQMTSQALTLWDGEFPVCCFGITSPWPGLGVAWCEERDQASMQAQARAIGRAIHRAWCGWLATGHYRRIESRAPADHAAAQRLLRWLRFTLVATKPHYGRLGETVMEYVYYPKE